jgi:hypothetical protein
VALAPPQAREERREGGGMEMGEAKASGGLGGREQGRGRQRAREKAEEEEEEEDG